MSELKFIYSDGKIATAKYDKRMGLLIPSVVNTNGNPLIAYSVVTKEEIVAMLDDIRKEQKNEKY